MAEVSQELNDAMMRIPGILDPKDRLFFRELAERVQNEFGIPTIVNIGVLKGASCYCFRVGAPDAVLVGVDIRDQSEIDGTPEMLEILNIKYLKGDSSEVSAKFENPIHLIFVDGGHKYKDVSRDIQNWVLPYVVPGGLALFHDAVFADGDPFHYVGIDISRAIDEYMDSDWEEQDLMFQTRWFVRKK